MDKWLIRIGYTLVLVGLLMLTPLADLMPVDFWYEIMSYSEKSAYSRIIPNENKDYSSIVMFSLGVVVIVISKFIGSKGNE